jgi:hypothetical protein
MKFGEILTENASLDVSIVKINRSAVFTVRFSGKKIKCKKQEDNIFHPPPTSMQPSTRKRLVSFPTLSPVQRIMMIAEVIQILYAVSML